jgi:hypothetical protein
LATKTPTAFVMTLAVKGRIVMEVSNQRTLREIAREIEANWLNINNQGAKKALDCMKTMGAIEAVTLTATVSSEVFKPRPLTGT